MDAWAWMALAFLGLLTVADTITANDLSTRTGPSPPGRWNLGTTSVVLSGVSDLTGQLLLGYLAHSRGRRCAMTVNTTSILAASTFALLSLFGADSWRVPAAIVTPLLKCFGGSSHASAFLALVVLRRQTSIGIRSAFFYSTGAVIVAAQFVGSFLAPLLASRHAALPCAISVACCLTTYGLLSFQKCLCPAPGPAATDQRESHAAARDREPDAAVRAPLIPRPSLQPPPGGDDDPQGASILSRAAARLDGLAGHAFSVGGRNLGLVIASFSLMAIAKATRPLFTTYIQHRDGATPKQAQMLWLVRSIMSIVIFGFVLPLVVLIRTPRASTYSNITLQAGRVSILLMGTGALLIGLSGSLPAITTALVINTLGVATDLSVLTFTSALVTDDTAPGIFMLIASCESAGILLGIGILYPVYQWSLDAGVPFFVAGLPYYLCALIYAVVSALIWNITPLPRDAELRG